MRKGKAEMAKKSQKSLGLVRVKLNKDVLKQAWQTTAKLVNRQSRPGG